MIVVTGASGHLGQWVVAELTARGAELLCVARRPLKEPTIDGLVWSRPVETLACDLADADEVDRVADDLLKAEAVVHLAAQIPAETAADPDAVATLRANTLPTLHLLRLLGRSKQLRSLVYASTFEVYGRPLSRPIAEDHPTRPGTFYGAAKLAGEQYVRLYGKDRGIPVCSLRLPAVYGPGDTLRRALGNFIRAAAAGEELVVHGDGDDMRDLVYAADAAGAFASAVERASDGTLNLGSGKGFRIREMAEAVRRVAGGEPQIARRDRAQLPSDIVLQIDRARDRLGWAPRTALDDGIRAQLDWVRLSGRR